MLFHVVLEEPVGVIFTRWKAGMNEPSNKRVSCFIDGQNLFHSAKKAFGYRYPNYDIKKLAFSVCAKKGWNAPVSIYFYTGIHRRNVSISSHDFWKHKMDAMKNEGIFVFYRHLLYSKAHVSYKRSSKQTLVGREKGIDVRLALDVVKTVSEDSCDVAIIFSQDQDFHEVAKDVRSISRKQDRWIKIASAFPVGDKQDKKIGIKDTDWIEIDRRMYDKCIDPKDYRS